MSLSGRPGNFGTTFHNYLYQKLGLNFIYKAFTTTELAQQQGKKTISGAKVIVLQAVEQFELYTGIRPDDQLVAEATDFARKNS